jgi:Fe-S oxidoreductase
VAVLRMLPRSGTGQLMSSYVNWITGPSRSADIEQSLTIGVHGPREMHCVILDNGRGEMLADPMFRDAMTCIRCGACSNACPPFMAVSGHQFGGHIYNGPIGLVLTPFHHGVEDADLANTLCAQCNACQDICPVEIPLPRMILEHRRKGRKSLRKRAVVGMWKRPRLADTLLRTAAPFTGLVPGTPRLARSPYRDRVRDHPAVDGEPLTIFASCLGDRAWPQAAVALERLASAAGFDVGFPKEQWCCGLVAANAGDFASGAKLWSSLADTLRKSKGLIVTPSASCFGAFTMDASEWGATPDPELSSRLRDSTRFALQLLEANPRLVEPGGMSLKIAYHDSCQTLRQLGLKSEPRRLLELAGYEVVDLPDIANCCGFGGSFSLEWPRVADRLAVWKLDAIAKTGCAVVASDNPGCLMHIAAAARKRGLDLRVAHVLELVAEHLTA